MPPALREETHRKQMWQGEKQAHNILNITNLRFNKSTVLESNDPKRILVRRSLLWRKRYKKPASSAQV